MRRRNQRTWRQIVSSSAARAELDVSVRVTSLWRADADITITDMLEPFWSETLLKCSRDFPLERGLWPLPGRPSKSPTSGTLHHQSLTKAENARPSTEDCGRVPARESFR
ncbi:hypothetical protein BRADO4222 [Bradyrhizobium sp. ORS 278]|nr:hypothetical protein BRADO4222 [Bradyrhizobium sp. ORS 278]